jgi:hypothetical protein
MSIVSPTEPLREFPVVFAALLNWHIIFEAKGKMSRVDALLEIIFSDTKLPCIFVRDP